LLEAFPELEARVASAELCRRARDSAGAEALLDALAVQALSEGERERVAAIRARIALDAGKLERASELLEPFARGVHSLEARALLEFARGRSKAAFDAASRARLHAAGDEERARAEAVIGMLTHAAGDAEPSLRAFRSAADFAARAGALLEEATYLTGLSAAATNLGELAEALSAARRAQLLFEALGRTADASRALLSTAQVYASAGGSARRARGGARHGSACQSFRGSTLSRLCAPRALRRQRA